MQKRKSLTRVCQTRTHAGLRASSYKCIQINAFLALAESSVSEECNTLIGVRVTYFPIARGVFFELTRGMHEHVTAVCTAQAGHSRTPS